VTLGDPTERKLVIIEGIMGSGKSTTVRAIAASLEQARLPARPIYETNRPHPVRGTDGLPHWYEPWLDVTPAELADRSLARWRAFVEASRGGDAVSVLDGQLFHGDLTNLFLMDAGWRLIGDYCRAVEEVAWPLNPLLVYLYQRDVERAIRVIADQRGEVWVKYQVDWKLQAPYSRQRGLSGLEGLIALYVDYRRLTDDLFASLGLARLAIETSAGNWPVYQERMRRALAIEDNAR
jgi:hypothetical protein